MNKGDYVLATKYNDGDPGDHWVVGFYDGLTDHQEPRHHVVDGNGQRFRHNGFRRCEVITEEEGAFILENKDNFVPLYWDDNKVLVGKSIWDWLDNIRALSEENKS